MLSAVKILNSIMEDPKNKSKDINEVTKDDQTNLNLGDKEEMSTASPDKDENKTEESSNKGQGPSGEDL